MYGVLHGLISEHHADLDIPELKELYGLLHFCTTLNRYIPACISYYSCLSSLKRTQIVLTTCTHTTRNDLSRSLYTYRSPSYTTACSSVSERDGKDQREGSKKHASSYWFARHYWLVIVAQNPSFWGEVFPPPYDISLTFPVSGVLSLPSCFASFMIRAHQLCASLFLFLFCFFFFFTFPPSIYL